MRVDLVTKMNLNQKEVLFEGYRRVITLAEIVNSMQPHHHRKVCRRNSAILERKPAVGDDMLVIANCRYCCEKKCIRFSSYQDRIDGACGGCGIFSTCYCACTTFIDQYSSLYVITDRRTYYLTTNYNYVEKMLKYGAEIKVESYKLPRMIRQDELVNILERKNFKINSSISKINKALTYLCKYFNKNK